MWETQLQFTYKDYNLERERVEVLLEKVSALHENLKPEGVMEIPGTEQQSRSEKWFSERWCRLTASKCLSAFKVGKLVTDCQPNAAVEANNFIFSHIWGLESEHFQSYWMRYGLESEPKAIEKYESTTNLKVYHSGLWVNPKFPFLGCSPDGLVGNDTVIEIKALKILKQYRVEAVTSPTSPVPKSVLIERFNASGRIPFNEDVTLDDHGYANMSWHCAGLRVSSPRSMLNLKSFIVFSVDLLSRVGYLKLSNTPMSIYLFGRSFKLYGATLWNGGHYICVFYFKNNWHMYDGLKEYTRKGSGFCSSPAMFCEPLGFTFL